MNNEGADQTAQMQRLICAKPSNHHEKKYVATALIEDIYKKRARVRKWW